jgi:mannose-6-phosphate isomerase
MNLGGNNIEIIDRNLLSNKKLSTGEYEYDLVVIKQNQTHTFESYRNHYVYVFEGSVKVEMSFASKGQVVNLSGVDQISCVGVEKKSVLFVASTKKLSLASLAEKIQIITEEEIKKVSKPWGYELWITGENNSEIAFKKIFITKGHKTSLQFHNFKKETNLLVDGEIIFHYKAKLDMNNLNVRAEDVAQKKLTSIAKIDVVPNVVHRIEAFSDTLLFEVSTPQLDDVVRIQDDSNRQSGRIESEHGNSKK